MNERNVQKCKYLYAHANIKCNRLLIIIIIIIIIIKYNNNYDDDDDDDDGRNRNNKDLLDQERNWEPEKEPLGTRVSLP